VRSLSPLQRKVYTLTPKFCARCLDSCPECRRCTPDGEPPAQDHVYPLNKRTCSNLSSCASTRPFPFTPHSAAHGYLGSGGTQHFLLGQLLLDVASLKSECIRPGTPLSLEDAKRLIQQYVDRYNNVRLHSAIGYVTPKDMLAGRQVEIHTERDRKLEAARQQRQRRRQQAA
jgi:hypothetical protein